MNALQKLSANGIPTAPKDAVAFWDNMAAQFARGSVAAQIMCGFAGIEWKKEMGFKHGGNRKSGSSADDSALDIRESVEAAFAFSYDTFRERIKMAEGVRADFKKLGLADRFKSLLLTHPSEWSEKDTKMFSDALHKVTSGMTQVDFFQKLGLAKGIGRNENPTGGPRGAALTPEEKAAIADPLIEIENNLFSLTDENDSTFAEVNSARLTKFQSVLSGCLDRVNDILKARKALAGGHHKNS